MTTRRYGDDEVRSIFRLATTDDTSDRLPLVESGGLTLAELQNIGREAGIDPLRVAHAAESLDARGTTTPVRRSFGLPIGMTRVVDLPRAPTDREWEQMISQFRSTFGEQGIATSTGGLREWTQGDLHISVEPTARGEQLRLHSLNSLAQVLNGLGVLLGGMSILVGAVVSAAGKPEKALLVLGLFGGISLAAFGTNIVTVPRWAREREKRMATTAEDVVKLLSDS